MANLKKLFFQLAVYQVVAWWKILQLQCYRGRSQEVNEPSVTGGQRQL